MLEFGPLGSGSGHDGLGSGNLGAGGTGWEDPLHLDWLTDHEVRYLLPPTQKTSYQTKVFQQSVTIVIKLQSNNTTGSGVPSMSERGVAVGPWRVPEDQLPVIVGTITGASLLVLLLLTLLFYTCSHHNPRHKKYSVKSEVSSVTSGHTQGSIPSLSRDSLIVVAHHPSTGHQACLLSERESPTDYLFECDCFCDPAGDPVCLCDYTDDDITAPNDNSVFEDGQLSPDDLPKRSLSMPFKQQQQQHQEEMGSYNMEETTNNNIIGCKPSSRPISNPVEFSYCDMTLPPSSSSEWHMVSGIRSRGLEGMALVPDSKTEELSASFSALDMVSAAGRKKDHETHVIDDTFKTRSLPAWIRNKTRPLAALDDLDTINEKPHWSKRRRNRMRSDAAAVIALSKSRGRLLSSGPATGSATSGQQSASLATTTSVAVAPAAAAVEGTPHPPSSPDTAALVNNEAVIVYDERTAL